MDGFISSEDVRLLLSYIPFRKSNSGSGKRSSDAKESCEDREGLYEASEGRNLDFKQRTQNQDEIQSFLDCAFSGDNNVMSLEAFTQFNEEVTSEMFVSVMAIFNERLPCAQFYFR